MPESNSQNATSIIKAFSIIDYISSCGEEASIHDISQHTGMNKSTIHRILNTMRTTGFIYQNKDNQKYGISLKFYMIAMRQQKNSMFLHNLAPYVKSLYEKYDECFSLAIRSLGISELPCYTILYGYQPQHVLRATIVIGQDSPAHATATGKCILAFSDREYISRYRGCALPAYTDKTITDWDRLDRELEDIRIKGYAVDIEEKESGLMGIAVPVFSENKELLAAISLTFPAVRKEYLDVEQIKADMKICAESASRIENHGNTGTI